MSAVQFRPEPPLLLKPTLSKVMKSQAIPIILNLIAAFLSAWGQHFYKHASPLIGKISFFKNYSLFAGMFLFLIVTVLFFLAFKLGGRLSVTYPVYATTFIWGAMIGMYIDKEPINAPQLFGILLVVLGVSVVALFSPSYGDAL